jgi:hypothetical protein
MNEKLRANELVNIQVLSELMIRVASIEKILLDKNIVTKEELSDIITQVTELVVKSLNDQKETDEIK